jgi:ABC-type antimicrobial peptide transport system permease subunit
LALLGAAIGLAGAFALSRLLGSLLFSVAPGDPLTYAAAAAFLLAVALAACWLPARRSMRVEPMEALRCE